MARVTTVWLRGLLEEAVSREEPDSRALWCLELGSLSLTCEDRSQEATRKDKSIPTCCGNVTTDEMAFRSRHQAT
jgi:hypothetical protein